MQNSISSRLATFCWKLCWSCSHECGCWMTNEWFWNNLKLSNFPNNRQTGALVKGELESETNHIAKLIFSFNFNSVKNWEGGWRVSVKVKCTLEELSPLKMHPWILFLSSHIRKWFLDLHAQSHMLVLLAAQKYVVYVRSWHGIGTQVNFASRSFYTAKDGCSSGLFSISC